MTNQLLEKAAKNHEIKFSKISAQDFRSALDTLIPQVLKEHEWVAMEAGLNYKDIFDSSPYENQLGVVVQYLDHLNSVCQTPEIREIYEEYIPKITAMYQDFTVDERMYYKLGAYTFTQDYKDIGSMNKKMIESILFNFEIQGVALSEEKKNSLKEIAVSLSELQTQFSNNLVDTQADISLDFTQEELSGLPERSINNLQDIVGTKDGHDIYRVSYSSGIFDDIMSYCNNAESRKKVYETQLQIGIKEGNDNRALLPQISSLMHKEASILGYDSFAKFNMIKNMVKEPQEAIDFIENLAKKSFDAAKKESASVESYGEQLLGRKVNFEDRAFVINHMRKTLLDIDPEKIRKYFPVKKVVSGLFSMLESLYGIEFVKKKEDLWHKDALCYELRQGHEEHTGKERVKNKEKIGTLYLDLYKREFKSSGAWMRGAVSRDVGPEGLKLPIAYIVCNAPKDLSQESTFEFEEIVTLFHEMGHALHHLLTKIDNGYYSGLNQVQHDAIELPSQFMENFCWDYEVLKTLSSHVETGETLPREIFETMLSSKNFLSASQMLRQAKFSQVDMKIYSDPSSDPLTVEKTVFDNWATSQRDERSCFLPTFSHIFAGGYSAGYYAYKWAEVLSADAFAALKESGASYLEQKPIAQKFRECILEQGGYLDMKDNFINFRGRNPDIKYLLEDSGIRVESAKLKR